MSSLSIAALAALFGFCGVIYEFVFAQSFSILFGQSTVQYALTIGLFLGGMGLGAKISESWQNPMINLRRLQTALAVGVPVVFIFVWFASIYLWTSTALIIGYGLCFAVGVLTGGELPLLLRLGGPAHLTLSADYIGMLAACALFPLLLLPWIGLFQSLFLAALGNSIGAAAVTPSGQSRRWLIPLFLILVFGFEPNLRTWLSAAFMGV